MDSSFSKENPNTEKALLDWPIALQYDIKARCQLISRKISGMKEVFSPERSLNQPKTTRAITNQIALFLFVCCFCFIRAFSFQGQTKIALSLQPSDSQCIDL